MTADNLLSAEPMRLAEAELRFWNNTEWMRSFYTDKRYPARLKQCHDSPPLIYFKGSSPPICCRPGASWPLSAHVQTTEHGKSLCEEIIEGLQPYNVLIVSGLAYGVDITAPKIHRIGGAQYRRTRARAGQYLPQPAPECGAQNDRKRRLADRIYTRHQTRPRAFPPCATASLPA